MQRNSDQLYIWLEGEPGLMPATTSIDDIPGESDLILIALAIEAGALGKYLPINLKFADSPEPPQQRVRSVDVARLLRTHNIRHRRRYEVFSEQIDAIDD